MTAHLDDPDELADLDERFSTLIESADTAMVVVTVANAGERSGCLVGFHGQSSIDPLRYTVWISKANHTAGLMPASSHLAVHFLTEADRDLAELFGSLSGDDVDKFARCDVEDGAHGVPLLARCPNRFVARRVALIEDLGDHLCVVTEPVAVDSAGPFDPMRLTDVDQFDAGHEADEA